MNNLIDIPEGERVESTIIIRDGFDSVGYSAGDRVEWIDAQSERVQ